MFGGQFDKIISSEVIKGGYSTFKIFNMFNKLLTDELDSRYTITFPEDTKSPDETIIIDIKAVFDNDTIDKITDTISLVLEPKTIEKEERIDKRFNRLDDKVDCAVLNLHNQITELEKKNKELIGIVEKLSAEFNAFKLTSKLAYTDADAVMEKKVKEEHTKGIDDLENRVSQMILRAINEFETKITKVFTDADEKIKEDLESAYDEADSSMSLTITNAYANAINTMKNTITSEYNIAIGNMKGTITNEYTGAMNLMKTTITNESAGKFQPKDT